MVVTQITQDQYKLNSGILGPAIDYASAAESRYLISKRSLSQVFNATLKISNNKLFSSQSSFVELNDLCLKNLELTKSDVYKNVGDAIILRGVQVYNFETRRVLLKENLVQESVNGRGIVIERSSLQMENNEVVKCDRDGIVVTSKASEFGQGTRPCIVQISTTLIKENKWNGILVEDFEGIFDLQDSIIS